MADVDSSADVATLGGDVSTLWVDVKKLRDLCNDYTTADTYAGGLTGSQSASKLTEINGYVGSVFSKYDTFSGTFVGL